MKEYKILTIQKWEDPTGELEKQVGFGWKPLNVSIALGTYAVLMERKVNKRDKPLPADYDAA